MNTTVGIYFIILLLGMRESFHSIKSSILIHLRQSSCCNLLACVLQECDNYSVATLFGKGAFKNKIMLKNFTYRFCLFPSFFSA